MNLRVIAIALAAIAVISFTAGYLVVKNNCDAVSVPAGLTLDAQKVLSATIESIKSESRLTSYSYVGTQHVAIHQPYWIIFKGQQQLIVPTTVSYYIDLDKLTASSVVLDKATNTVKITLPRLMLTVSIDPIRATFINNWPIVFTPSVRDALEKLNYQNSILSAIKQGQQPELVKQASERTKQNIERLFRVPLYAAGMNDLQINVVFSN
jgi:hypothetical protein